MSSPHCSKHTQYEYDCIDCDDERYPASLGKQEVGICPKCDGTCRMPVPELSRQYAVKNGWYGYSITDDKITCDNCGAQHMFGQATGKVFARADGTPCLHEYAGTKIGNCLWRYDCKHCPESFVIDSGD